MDYQPFGNDGGGIYRLREGVRPPPKIGLGPHLKKVSHKDETKRSN